ncbi:hypothetical protein W97_07236 [Coniosporium apollinis CBS 100218]|uniref:C2H2-type domain-containing protein n=1 Tax=Coniosporium apollinis (strain CBS 100218) TaxID=1168221 RepID=R7Z1Z0_CONA1|nr:uncharacterized protein W97_07236 [Coniosporium apollinis CBS 100218]EON68088.1 hypothetical protein W97_07236 [Coniosporium apollinis CBS 100218]
MATQLAAGPMPSQPEGSHSSHPFTCNTCQVAFRSSELQRTHMQSDWHRYNLKRRVASLPPLSSEIFAEKVLANKASAAATAAKAAFERPCAACQKTYFSENAYQNHLNSQKHRINVLRQQGGGSVTGTDDETGSMISSTFSLGEPIDTASNGLSHEAEAEFQDVVDSMKQTSLQDGEPISRRPTRPHHSAVEEDARPAHPLSPLTTRSTTASSQTESATSEPKLSCLFCNFLSPTFPLNILHMQRHHGMFIPEREFLVDEEGLVAYLHAKIHEDHQCLYCGKLKHTAAGIQTHMRDRGHCMIAFNTEEEMIEIGQFYDFRSTYSDGEGDDSDATSTEDAADAPAQGGVKLGAPRRAKLTVENLDASQPDAEMADGDKDDEGWETDSTLSTVPTDEITSVPIDDRSHLYATLARSRHHSHTDPRPHRAADGFHSHAHGMPHAVYHDDHELHLPSGRVAGHRSLNRYFRQNLRSYESGGGPGLPSRRAIEAGSSTSGSDGERAEDGDRGRGRNALISRANGGLGMVGVSDATRREVTKVEKRERKREQRAQARYQWGNNKRSNFQEHFRDPLLQ